MLDMQGSFDIMRAVNKKTSVPADTPQPTKEQTIVWLRAIATERDREAFGKLRMAMGVKT